ncbi:MAG: WXG100 family type VII secretion target [Pseudonocardiaceae bacterium]
MSTLGSGFGTELPTMQAAAKHVDTVNQQIQGQLHQLMDKLDALATAWQGQAAGSFHQLKVRWNDNANQLNLALKGIGEGLAKSHQTYQTHEASNAQDFSRVNLD